jgi:hypothetical protein
MSTANLLSVTSGRFKAHSAHVLAQSANFQNNCRSIIESFKEGANATDGNH